MGALRTKMIEEMRLRNFSPRTEQSYVAAIVGLSRYYRRSPDQLTQDEIRSYLLHLQERGLSASSRNVAISGLKFFYHQILDWDEQKLFLPPRKGSWRLPEVLSPKEVERLLCAHGKLRDRCLLMTAYATGLRVSELVRLKVSDIDSERMMVKVEQGKGKKDRYTIYQSGCFQSFAPIGKSIARQSGFSPTERAVRFRSTTPRGFTTGPNRKLKSTKVKASTPCATALPPIF
jgi:integrase/recombinase XerD